MKIDHFALEVSDLERSVRFYIDRLGFTLQATFKDDNEHETLAVVETEGGKLELIQALDAQNQPRGFEPIPLREHFCPHLALQVDDLQAFLGVIRQHGLTLLRGPLEIPRLVRWLYIADPDNNVIEFFQDQVANPALKSKL